MRDVFVVLFRDSIKFDSTYVTTSYSLRDLTDIYLAKQPWGDLGIDICLGLPMDKLITPFEYMFLPDYVESGFDHATLGSTPIVREKKVIYEARPEPTALHWFHPWLVFGLFLLFTLVLSYSDWQKKKPTKWFDVALFSTAGWVGVLLLFLWAATNNFNVLWAFPLHALAAIFLLRKQFYPVLSNYFRVVGVLSAASLLLWFFLPQRLNVYLIPFVMALGIRAFTMAKFLAIKDR